MFPKTEFGNLYLFKVIFGLMMNKNRPNSKKSRMVLSKLFIVVQDTLQKILSNKKI